MTGTLQRLRKGLGGKDGQVGKRAASAGEPGGVSPRTVVHSEIRPGANAPRLAELSHAKLLRLLIAEIAVSLADRLDDVGDEGLDLLRRSADEAPSVESIAEIDRREGCVTL